MTAPTRILAVDDSATIRTALQLILAPTGHAVELASSGAEAIANATANPPALVLLDFILPDMRGSDVCRALLADAHTRTVPVVLVSARGAEIRQVYEDLDNVVAYLAKPFTPEQVHAVIDEALATPVGAVRKTAAVAPATGTDVAAPAYSPEIPATTVQPVDPSWNEADDAADDNDPRDTPDLPPAARRELLDAMFETLRAGLEGVHVEEGDAPAGAAERSRSFSELAAHLTRQLSETMTQAAAGAPFSLGHDGSIRSLEDALLDTYRRVCRLLFRAVGAGMIDATRQDPPLRVLVVGRGEGEIAEAVDAGLRGLEAHVFRIASGFCQLPLMARCFAPTHVVVDLTGPTLWQELATLRRMPESRRVRVIALAAAGAPPDADLCARHGITDVLTVGPRLAAAVRRTLSAAAGAPATLPAPAERAPASAAA